MKLLQTMSLSGGIAVLCYWLIKTVFGNAFSGRFYKRLLQFTMFFFILPFPKWKYQYADLLKWVFPLGEWGMEQFLPQTKIGVPIKHIIYYTHGGDIYIVQWYYYFFSAACLLVMLVYMTWQFYNDRKFKKNICQHSEIVKTDLEFCCREWIRRLKIVSKVEIRESNRITSPITLGCFRSIVVFPKVCREEETVGEMELMLLHELVHVKKKDVFFSMLGMGILALNFYNPLAYYFYWEWGRIRELACDEKVIMYVGEEKKGIYGNLIISMAERNMFAWGFQTGFSKKNLTRERIENMMKERKNKWYQKVMGIGLVLGMTFLTSLTVFAYQPDVWREVEDNKADLKLKDRKITEMYISEEELEEILEVKLDGKSVPFDFLEYEQEIIYLNEDGNVVIKEYAEQTAVEREFCIHSYTNGYLRMHDMNGDGGCTITIYKVEYCSKCNAVRNQTYVSSANYAVCTH